MGDLELLAVGLTGISIYRTWPIVLDSRFDILEFPAYFTKVGFRLSRRMQLAFVKCHLRLLLISWRVEIAGYFGLGEPYLRHTTLVVGLKVML